jgi:hypothetical protein
MQKVSVLNQLHAKSPSMASPSSKPVVKDTKKATSMDPGLNFWQRQEKKQQAMRALQVVVQLWGYLSARDVHKAVKRLACGGELDIDNKLSPLEAKMKAKQEVIIIEDDAPAESAVSRRILESKDPDLIVAIWVECNDEGLSEHEFLQRLAAAGM